MKAAFKGEVPMCFTPMQYKAWRALARFSHASDGPCTDCTPGFQARMKQAGKCEHPEIEFDEDEDGVIVGRRPR